MPSADPEYAKWTAAYRKELVSKKDYPRDGIALEIEDLPDIDEEWTEELATPLELHNIRNQREQVVRYVNRGYLSRRARNRCADFQYRRMIASFATAEGGWLDRLEPTLNLAADEGGNDAS